MSKQDSDDIRRYTLKQGKLVPLPSSQKKGVVYACGALLLIGCSVLSYDLGTQHTQPPDGSLQLTEAEWNYYNNLERAYDHLLKTPKGAEERALNMEQLTAVFDNVFSDVKLSDSRKKQYLESATKWASHYSMPVLLILSIVWRESTFNEKTVSVANAKGPMQVIYKYHAEKLQRINKQEQDLQTIDTGIRIGVEVLREYFDKYDRNIFQALRAYVGGTHRTYAQDILTRYFNARIFVDEQLDIEKEKELQSHKEQ